MDKNFGQKLMLEEYKKAQDSAEHHDHMAWLMSSVLVVASVTLLGFLVGSIHKTNPFLILLGCVVGFLLIIVNIFIFNNAQELKKSRYKICKEIEQKFNSILKNKKDWQGYQFKNHLSTTRRKRCRPLYFGLLGTIAISFLILAFLVIHGLI